MDKLPEKSYTVKEVATRLGVTYDHIYRLCKYGTIESFKVGTARRISEKAILEYLNRGNEDGQN